MNTIAAILLTLYPKIIGVIFIVIQIQNFQALPFDLKDVIHRLISCNTNYYIVCML